MKIQRGTTGALAAMVIFLLPSPLAFAQTSNRSEVLGTVKELRAFRFSYQEGVLPEDHDDVPPRIRFLQKRFKHQLCDLITGILNMDRGSASPDEFRSAIHFQLMNLGILSPSGMEELPNYTYGHVLGVTVEAVPQQPKLLAVGVIIDAYWDRDESLYIFRRSSTEWTNTLAAEVNDYSTIIAAQSSRFNYVVSPPATDGSWFVVTSSVNPHKVSAWQHVTYTALAPGPDAYHPRMLVRRTHTLYVGGDDESRACMLNAKATGFRVSFVGDVMYSAGQYYNYDYKVTGRTARLIRAECVTTSIVTGKNEACRLR
jgi:hypothetical protein